MDTGYYKFYKNRWVVLSYNLGFVACFFFLLDAILNRIVIMGNTFLALCSILGIVFCMIKGFIIPLFKKELYIEMTPDYVQIGKREKLLWTDIERIEKKKRRGIGYVYNLWLKEISKHNLNKFQKLNPKLQFSPFNFEAIWMRWEDVKKLEEILKEKVPNNNLD